MPGRLANFHNGITLEGKCLNTMMSKLTFTHCITGVQVRGESEGTKITQSEILATYFGIYNDTPVGEAGEWVTDTHISCARAGIVSRQRPQAFYSNLLIYRHHWRATDAFDGILILEGSHDTNLHDIMVKTFDQPGAAVYVHPGVNHVTQTNIHVIAGATRQA